MTTQGHPLLHKGLTHSQPPAPPHWRFWSEHKLEVLKLIYLLQRSLIWSEYRPIPALLLSILFKTMRLSFSWKPATVNSKSTSLELLPRWNKVLLWVLHIHAPFKEILPCPCQQQRSWFPKCTTIFCSCWISHGEHLFVRQQHFAVSRSASSIDT